MNDDLISYSFAKHPAPHRGRVRLGLLFTALFAGPIVWAGDLWVTFILVGHSCYPGNVPLDLPTIGDLWPVVLACHIVALALIAAGTAAGYWCWHVTAPEASDHLTPKETSDHYHHLIERGEGRTRYLGIVAMGFGAMFFVITAIETLSLAWVSPCSY